MRPAEEKYISLLTDFGFKRIFGKKPNKMLLIDFLNALFDGEQVVRDVTYLNSEHVGDVYAERKAIFDVYCENERGEKFIVEMQNAYQTYFKDRSLYYATFPIREQAPKGSAWDFQLQHVYVVALLNYDLQEAAFAEEDIHHDVGLLDKKTHRVFNNKLTFKYVEIAKFDKPLEKLETCYDKWLFVLKTLSRLERQPKELRDKVFDRVFKEAEIAQFTPAVLRHYEDSLKSFRDVNNSIDSAEEKGRAEGREEGRAEGRAEGLAEGLAKGQAEGERAKAIEIAKQLLAMHLPVESITKATGLSSADITALK